MKMANFSGFILPSGTSEVDGWPLYNIQCIVFFVVKIKVGLIKKQESKICLEIPFMIQKD